MKYKRPDGGAFFALIAKICQITYLWLLKQLTPIEVFSLKESKLTE